MRRFGLILVLLGLVVGVAPGVAQDVPPHAHMLVQRPVIDVIEFEGELWVAAVGFRKCVDLAANRAIPLNAHHAHIHTGKAGEMLDTKAGHAVVPTSPVTPWENCAALEAALPILFEPLE
jgi:hypothetical protein